MKTSHFLTITLCCLLITATSQAQSSQYETAMKENLEKMAKWSERPQSLAASFERIARAEQSQWLPYYYAAYATLIESFNQKDAQLKDKTIDQAQDLLDAAFLLNPDSSECMVMQGFLFIGRLQADPVARGAEFSQKANDAFDNAIKLNPENPRAYYMKGITVLNTPDFFGGGKKPAKPILELAVGKYTTFKPASTLSPDWGKEDCAKQFAACQ